MLMSVKIATSGIALSKDTKILNKINHKIILEYHDEPVEICNQLSCNYTNYLMFRNSFIKSLYKVMAEQFDSIFKVNIKEDKVKIIIDWYSEKFNDDLFEWDFTKIKESVKEIFTTSGVIGRKDKFFINKGNLDELITINKHYGKENFIITLDFISEVFNVNAENEKNN